MPLYFAYGSNMDEAAMRARCPRARALCRARLVRHRFFLMGRTGYASVRRDPKSDVHGVLFDLALSDVAPLDRYEDIDNGLYTKMVHPVVRADGLSRRALIYFGTDASEGGHPLPGYMEAIVAAARVAALPAPHIAMLERLVPGRGTAKPPRGTRPAS